VSTVQSSLPLAPDTVLRLFIAVPVAEPVRRSLGELVRAWRQTPARVSWVQPANLHITLVFLGAVFAARVPDLAAALDAAGTAVPPFDYTVVGAGFFGSPRAPKVLWAGIEDPTGALTGLHERVRASVRELGLMVDSRPFTPHLTLGRVRASRGADALTSRIASATNARFGVTRVGEVRLMQSHLDPQGVRYTVLHESLLKGA